MQNINEIIIAGLGIILPSLPSLPSLNWLSLGSVTCPCQFPNTGQAPLPMGFTVAFIGTRACGAIRKRMTLETPNEIAEFVVIGHDPSVSVMR